MNQKQTFGDKAICTQFTENTSVFIYHNMHAGNLNHSECMDSKSSKVITITIPV